MMYMQASYSVRKHSPPSRWQQPSAVDISSHHLVRSVANAGKSCHLMSMSSFPWRACLLASKSPHTRRVQGLTDSCTDVQTAPVVVTKISIVIPFFASTFLISAVNSLSFESTAEVFSSEDRVTEWSADLRTFASSWEVRFIFVPFCEYFWLLYLVTLSHWKLLVFSTPLQKGYFSIFYNVI